MIQNARVFRFDIFSASSESDTFDFMVFFDFITRKFKRAQTKVGYVVFFFVCDEQQSITWKISKSFLINFLQIKLLQLKFHKIPHCYGVYAKEFLV